MSRIFPRRPSPAIVVALLALFVAMGAGAYAAIKLPKNSVGTKQLKKNAVISSKVKDGSLLKKDFKTGQLPAGPRGAQGNPGPTGSPGPSAAFSRFNDAPAAFTSTTTLAHLDLGSGNYVIFGKLWLTNNSATFSVLMHCSVTAGADSDTTRVHLQKAGTDNADSQALAFTVVHSSAAGFAVDLACDSFGISVSASDVKLTAIQVGSLTNDSM